MRTTPMFRCIGTSASDFGSRLNPLWTHYRMKERIPFKIFLSPDSLMLQVVPHLFNIFRITSGCCGFGGLMVSMLASGTQDRGFDPGRSLRIFGRKNPQHAFLVGGGSKAVSHVADLRGMSKNPGFTWKSKSQAKFDRSFLARNSIFRW